VLGSNPRFLCPKSKIFCANTYISHVDMLICNFIKSFPNFETVFDKISPKKNYIFTIKNWIKFFNCCQTLIRLLSQTTETTIWIILTSPSKYWWNTPSTCLFFSVWEKKSVFIIPKIYYGNIMSGCDIHCFFSLYLDLGRTR
jgi:hypothetical protein